MSDIVDELLRDADYADSYDCPEDACRWAITMREAAAEIRRLRSLTTWRPITEKPESGRRIVCLFDDGSGATLFIVHDHGFIDADGDEYDKLTSYEKWAYLPDGHELHCEGFDDFGLPPPPETKTPGGTP